MGELSVIFAKKARGLWWFYLHAIEHRRHPENHHLNVPYKKHIEGCHPESHHPTFLSSGTMLAGDGLKDLGENANTTIS